MVIGRCILCRIASGEPRSRPVQKKCEHSKTELAPRARTVISHTLFLARNPQKMESLLNFGAELDVALLDQAVTAFYTGRASPEVCMGGALDWRHFFFAQLFQIFLSRTLYTRCDARARECV